MRRIIRGSAGRALVLTSLAALAACGTNDAGTGPGTNPGEGTVTLAAGASAPIMNGQQQQIAGGATGSEFVLVVTDTTAAGTGTSAFTLTATGIGAAGSVSGPSAALVPTTASLDMVPSGPTLDIAYGSRLNERFRSLLKPQFGTARQASLASRSVSASVAQVGDVISLNVNEESCDSSKITLHPARVVAIGSQAMIVADTLNPPGGFSAADYQRIAANFDTLVYPLDVSNFGAPTDIDGNGHVTLFFTRAVNELTPAKSQSFVGGFFSSRDLFPRTGTTRLQGCPGSNVGELFYLLAPDPTGVVNGNTRTTGFVDSLTTGVVAHEFQHLINASRRVFVNNASDFETVWLNEGLSHVAEELLFYRQSGLAPRQNIDVATIRASERARGAFNMVQGANASRYRSFLLSPESNSPVRDDDSLATRGATWDFLRYAADRKARSGGADVQVWQALVNSTQSGLPNLRAVFGADVGGMLRDWNVSHYTDDVVTTVGVDFTQPSWNWHNIYAVINSGYPLKVTPLAAGATSGTVIPGGAAYYRFSVPANTTAAVTIAGGAAASGVPQGVVVRIR